MRKIFEIGELKDGRLRFESVADMDELTEALVTFGHQGSDAFSAVVSSALALLSELPDEVLDEIGREFRRDYVSVNVS